MQLPGFVYMRGCKDSCNSRIETRPQSSPLPPLGDDLPASVKRLFSCRARTTIGWAAWMGRAWGPASTSYLKKNVSCYCPKHSVESHGSSEARGDSLFAADLVYSSHLDFDGYASIRMTHTRTRPLYLPCKLMALPVVMLSLLPLVRRKRCW
jgi:hypothetical protein